MQQAAVRSWDKYVWSVQPDHSRNKYSTVINVIDFKDDVISIYLHWFAIMNWMWIEVD